MEEGAKIKFSIVTVCRNAETSIEKTMQSVLHQTHPNLEYIVIDGASTDNTLAIVNKYRDKITKIISEPDTGIYDAMNKGIREATGDYIYFLNAADSFISEHVLARAARAIESGTQAPDVLYGNIFVFEEKELWAYIHSVKHISSRLLILDHPHHQAAFTRLALLKEKNFDIVKYPLGAEVEWFIYAYMKKQAVFKYADLLFAVFDPQGFSAQSHRRIPILEERAEALKTHYSSLQLAVYIGYNYLKTLKYSPARRKYIIGILNVITRYLWKGKAKQNKT